MCKIIREIKKSENPFGLFTELFNANFKSIHEKNNIPIMQFYETIFLVVLEMQNEYLDLQGTRIGKEFLSGISIKLPFVSLSVDAFVNRDKDLPTDLDKVWVSGDADFDLFSTALAQYRQANLTPLSKFILLRFLAAKVRVILDSSRSNQVFLVGRRNIAFNYLMAARVYLDAEFALTAGTRIQIHELVGKSGIGKSQSVQSLGRILQALIPFIPSHELVYTRANDYWWNGYVGQPIVLYDDFTHITKKMKFDLVFELISIGSGTLRNPPMAFAKDMLFGSTLVVVTSNIPLATVVGRRETNDALKRRVISQRWDAMPGTMVNGKFTFNGSFSNVLLNANGQFTFEMFKESVQILNESKQVEITLKSEEDFIYDDEEEEQEESATIQTTPKLTSSVSESYSAIVGVDETDEAMCKFVNKLIFDICKEPETPFLQAMRDQLTRSSKEYSQAKALHKASSRKDFGKKFRDFLV